MKQSATFELLQRMDTILPADCLEVIRVYVRGLNLPCPSRAWFYMDYESSQVYVFMREWNKLERESPESEARYYISETGSLRFEMKSENNTEVCVTFN